MTTFVTCFHDLSKYEDRKGYKDYKVHIDNFLSAFKGYDVIIYCDPEYFETFNLFGYTVIPRRLEESPYYTYLGEIKESFKTKYPRGLSSTKDTALYFILMWTKFYYLKKTIIEGKSKSEDLFWIDMGIFHVVNPNDKKYISEILEVCKEKDKISIGVMRHPDPYSSLAYSYRHCSVMGGFFGGQIANITTLMGYAEEELNQMKMNKAFNNDECILSIIYYKHPELFIPYYGDYEDLLRNFAMHRGAGKLIQYQIDYITNNKLWKRGIEYCDYFYGLPYVNSLRKQCEKNLYEMKEKVTYVATKPDKTFPYLIIIPDNFDEFMNVVKSNPFNTKYFAYQHEERKFEYRKGIQWGTNSNKIFGEKEDLLKLTSFDLLSQKELLDKDYFITNSKIGDIEKINDYETILNNYISLKDISGFLNILNNGLVKMWYQDKQKYINLVRKIYRLVRYASLDIRSFPDLVKNCDYYTIIYPRKNILTDETTACEFMSGYRNVNVGKHNLTHESFLCHEDSTIKRPEWLKLEAI